jgi:hypothetical protein
MKTFSKTILFTLCWLATPIFSEAQSIYPSAIVAPVVVYNSFGPGNSFISNVGWGVSGASSSLGYRGQAETFVPGISGSLSSIQLAMFHSSGSGRSNFYLAEDNGSGLPGTILESYLNVFSPGGVLTLSSSTQSLLQAGVKYWVEAEPADATTVSGWYENNQSIANGFAFESSQGAWGWVTPPAPPSGVFRISVTPVPEPSTLGLVCLGGYFLSRRFRKQRAA